LSAASFDGADDGAGGNMFRQLNPVCLSVWLEVAKWKTRLFMARKILKRLLPDPNSIKRHRSLRLLGKWINDPNIWHLNRQSVTVATFVGLFCAFIPLPGQMVIAAALAVRLRANLAISVCLVWVSNPITMAPIFYFCYKIGALVLDTPAGDFVFELSWTWLSQELSDLWQPFLLGCLINGVFFGVLGSALIRWLWRRHTIKRWRERRLNRNTN
jgi:uncharacterized protein (DUF2062 family)